MTILHILKTEPDKITRSLMDLVSEGEESTMFALYEEGADYEKLIDLIFEKDSTISWW